MISLSMFLHLPSLSGKDKEHHCRTAINQLEAVLEEVMVAAAKFDQLQSDAADDACNEMKAFLKALNTKAEDNIDAAKIVRSKLSSFLAGL